MELTCFNTGVNVFMSGSREDWTHILHFISMPLHEIYRYLHSHMIDLLVVNNETECCPDCNEILLYYRVAHEVCLKFFLKPKLFTSTFEINQMIILIKNS